ncbi:hypothetical protein N7447_006826 [Penicillium robsamsonii]|uniref:uncharacterized protein n=1 Tax=Penicillium robsamsonii TaxID=1792511 RepID=UPI00254856B8|nr:uncharacterized protein N7447_006826 [Penicillium robsamsonii]KAJ5824486.1 hypothetical protein N7447_006826 [Penicillium robsamsonii]
MPRIWFITGCSSGFGRQLAITAAENKETVVATSRDPSKLSDLTSMGVIAKKLDVQASDNEVKAVIDDVVSTVGPIDILIRILRAALPSMRAHRFGVVTNFGSIAGWQSAPAVGVYCATKAAIALYTETLRNELAPFNIEVTCVEPGYFRTNFLTGGHKITAKNRIPELDSSRTGFLVRYCGQYCPRTGDA